ncbi:hypothetical protein OG946_02920 [Streptomyces sp. NBC_01808]|uniref:hypothetical protein n=1 Tax=Streptomyces sp. NBC_01808 TaxID=2975947 RepID=UPI002DD8E84D|nr:hypothetical protein [Streptomyces sp. NBC_01808]WSA36421.1 hypothetical protein OG946_02920 [Streptomyces sp. NBC_01808]
MQPEALSAKGRTPPGGTDGTEGTAPQPALELLVHGVGGATPQEMLGDPRTELVTGDRTAGIHRRTDDVRAEESAGGAAGEQRGEGGGSRTEPVQEAYCWSNLTSGNGARALWLVLLPFMIANLAHWMRPAAPSHHGAHRAYDVLVRIFALTLTVQFVLAAGEVTLDLLAWQCAGSTHCVAGKSWLGFMSAESGGWFGGPGRRLALAALVPVLLTALLWWLSRRTWSIYESAKPSPRAGAPGAAGEQPALSLPGFWYGRRLVARLRAAHTATGLLAVASALIAVTVAADDDTGGGLRATGWVLGALTAAGWIAVVALVCRSGRTEAEPDMGEDRRAVRALPLAALALLAAVLVHTAWSRPDWVSTGRLPGTSVFGGLAVAQGVLAAGLAVTGLLLQRRATGEPPALRGLGGACVALLASAVAGVFSGGIAQRVADWLDRGATPGENGPLAGPPVVLSWQATAIPVIALLVLLLALAGGWRMWVLRRRIATEVAGLYPTEHRYTEDNDPRTGRIAGAIARARLTDDAPPALGAAALATLVLGAGAVLGAWLTDEVPGRAARGAPGPLPGLAQTGQALGSWMMGAGVILLLAMGRQAYRDPKSRRTVGILWDVGTFWPRAAHPFAPPCYAERAVPDLAWRTSTWTTRTGGCLVISGHSQGSVLAAAAVWQLDPDIRGRVALLTYGSPLRRLYGRWFPAYFGDRALAELDDQTHAWRNLWRLTDPIGGPVRPTPPDGRPSDVDRKPLKDPLAFERTPEHPLPAAINAHSDYQADPAFAVERAELIARISVAPAAPAEEWPRQVPRPAGEPDAETADGVAAQGRTGMSSA